MLLAEGADTELVAANGRGSLLQAVFSEHASVVKRLIQVGAYLLKRETDTGKTALIVAATLDSLEMADLLIDGGADRTLVDLERHTAYEVSIAEYGASPVAQLLLQKLKIA